jgi:iron complex outermembrane receptor protein
LYGVPYPASAQQAPSSQAQTGSPSALIQEIVVTATRREQTAEEVPYSISVIGSDELARTGVTDIASLAAQVPGLSQFDFGARNAAALTPIIRGLSANGAQAGGEVFRTFEQSPVGTYIGNAPVTDGYFQLDDVQRIEVLRGPQGTLYGAGALGGAIRIIPNDPELNTWAGRVEASGGSVDHASDASYTTSAMLNAPIGDTLALRLSGKYAFEPGFVKAYGILERPGPYPTGVPVLADPADPVNSPGVYTSNNNWGDQNTFTGRASLLWKPGDNFSADLTFLYANLNGDGGPTANPGFPGGPNPLDPGPTVPAGGDYRTCSALEQP